MKTWLKVWLEILLLAAVYSDKWCTASVPSIAVTEPIGATESQLLSSWFGSDLPWICAEAVWIHWRRTDSVCVFPQHLHSIITVSYQSNTKVYLHPKYFTLNHSLGIVIWILKEKLSSKFWVHIYHHCYRSAEIFQ